MSAADVHNNCHNTGPCFYLCGGVNCGTHCSMGSTEIMTTKWLMLCIFKSSLCRRIHYVTKNLTSLLSILEPRFVIQALCSLMEEAGKGKLTSLYGAEAVFINLYFLLLFLAGKIGVGHSLAMSAFFYIFLIEH